MTTHEVLQSLHASASGLGPASFELPFDTAVGALPGPLPGLPSALEAHDTRLARMAFLLASDLRVQVKRAVDRWGAARVALVVASSTAGIAATENALAVRSQSGSLPKEYSFERQHALHAVLSVLRQLTGARGPAYVVSTACSSGNKVWGTALRLIRSDFVDAVVVGGIDTLCQMTLRGFHSLGILSTRPCLPFGRDRDGLSIGEGGALLLLERRGEGLAQLLGVGETSDAHHMTQPHPQGAGARSAMELALAAAGLEPANIDHINAHGTGTPLNDASEARAITGLFGHDVPVASTKGYTGHILGGSASIEAVFAIDAIQRGVLPKSLGAEPRDPTIQLRLTQQPTPRRCRYVLSNAFAFGGNNAAVVFGAAS